MQLEYNTTTPGGCAVALCAHYTGLVLSNDISLKPSVSSTSIHCDSVTKLTEPIAIGLFLISKIKNPEVAISLLCSSDEFQKAEVDRWLSFVAEKDFICSDATSLHLLNSHLTSRTFFVENHITIADLFLFAALHSWMLSNTTGERTANNHITRWFNHIQHLPGILNTEIVKELFPMIPIDIGVNVASAETATLKDTASTKKTDTNSKNTDQQQQKEGKKNKEQKKVKQEKPQKENSIPATPERPIEDPTRLEIRVGKIVKAWNHPEAERLYCEEVDIGEPTTRKIASGLREHIAIDEFEGKKVLVLANMKEKKLRGFPSHGMILCGKKDINNGQEKVELVLPSENAQVGERVQLEGYSGEPDAVMNTKTGKDPFVAVQPGFRIDENGIAYWKDAKFIASGECRCLTIRDGAIS